MHIKLLFFLLLPLFTFSQSLPSQPSSGPGSPVYLTDSIHIIQAAEDEKGYWAFLPIAENLDTAHVVVFVHGYGAINPKIYGSWIKHLVKKGNIVIYPRYQKKIFLPRAKTFVPNAVAGIHAALDSIKKSNILIPELSHFSVVGHSYGGAISANLAAAYAQYDLPRPVATFLCQPGTGPLKGALKESYGGMPWDMKLMILTSEKDHIVKDKLGRKIFERTWHIKDRQWVRLYQEKRGDTKVGATHNEPISLDESLDIDFKSNYAIKKARKWSKTNAVDYFAFWKILDALHECTRNNEYCEYLENSPELKNMGDWSDGQPVRKLEVQKNEGF